MNEPTITIIDPSSHELPIEELAAFSWFLDEDGDVMLKVPHADTDDCWGRQLLRMKESPISYPFGTAVKPLILTSTTFERT